MSVSGIKLSTQSHILKVDDAGGSKGRFSVTSSMSCGISKEGGYSVELEQCKTETACLPWPHVH